MQFLCYVSNLNLKHKLFQMFSAQNLEHGVLNIQMENFWCTRLGVERFRFCLFLCHFRCFPEFLCCLPDMSSKHIWWVMLAHQEGALMWFIIVYSKMGSISGCNTSISDMKKTQTKQTKTQTPKHSKRRSCKSKSKCDIKIRYHILFYIVIFTFLP